MRFQFLLFNSITLSVHTISFIIYLFSTLSSYKFDAFEKTLSSLVIPVVKFL